jgi:hypothetical protein
MRPALREGGKKYGFWLELRNPVGKGYCKGMVTDNLGLNKLYL